MASTTPALPGTLTRAMALAGVVTLIALGLAWELWLAPTGQRTLAVKILPLLPALPGLWRNRLYTYRWLSLMIWLYFIEGVVRTAGDGGAGAVLAAIEVALSLVVFAACAAHVRLTTRPRQAKASP